KSSANCVYRRTSIAADALTTIITVPLHSQDLVGRNVYFYWLEPRQTLSDLLQRGLLGHAADFPQQIIGEGQAFKRSPRLELAVQGFGHMANLDHLFCLRCL